MSNYFYYQAVGGEEDWKAVPAASIDHIRIELQPMFITVLSVSKLVEDLSYEDKMKLAYDGPMYFDFDSTDEQLVIEKVKQFLNKLESLKVDLSMIRLYATGGRGYHIEIPQGVFMAKPKPVTNLPAIYREIALDLCVDTLDLRVYSQGRGRMWRQCGVKRDNGRYKVPVSVAEMRAMTPEACQQLTSTPRQPIGVTAPKLCIDLSILYDRCAQKVEDLFKKRLKFKPDPAAKEKAYCDSIQWMMAGLGLKPGVGFQEISTQLAIAASTAGLTEDQFIADCQGIIDNHVGNGNRYDSPAKRSDELRRMYRYMYGNLCYEFSVGAIKSLLIHPAPDLDGIHMTKEEVAEVIKEAEAEDKADVDEYSDVAKGLSMTKFGVYVDTELGKKRVCAMSFTRSAILKSIENGQISGYETDVLVNGKFAGRQTLELDVFSGLVPFNRFAARYGHAFQGTDAHVRILMMRFVEDAKKKGEEKYIVQREGLDVVHIPHHPNPVFREEFLTWSDSEGVVMPEHVTSEGLNLTFAGYPDPRGVYKTDIRDAPNLAEWIKEGDNKQELLLTLRSLITCQKSELLGKLIGWYTACYWRQLFHKVYGKFPLMHVNGGAGSGKCLAKDTPVIMADGSIKMVQDILVGDQLLGPDGTVRNVLSLARGREQMYKVTPVKGDAYTVNASHILSLKLSTKKSLKLSDGTRIPANADVVNVNIETFYKSKARVRKELKGWRTSGVDFHRAPAELLLDPYWLGLWLGDGDSDGACITKPEGPITDWWISHAHSKGHLVTHYDHGTCPNWNITTKTKDRNSANFFTLALKKLGVQGNKHIPDNYKYADRSTRLKLIAGLLDSDGHMSNSGYDWISKDKQMAEDLVFICRSVGLAAYLTSSVKGIKSTGFKGNYWRVSISGDCSVIPCLQKPADERKQIKRVTVTGITVEPVGEGDYYGFTIDGDHLFMLGDFTVTHNTEMSMTIANLFYYKQDVKSLTPGSTPFAMQQHLTASSSIPLIFDEYKPHEMNRELHNKMKAIFRDAYNQKELSRGGGSRESSDYRILQTSQLSAPIVFIAEATEEEAAVMERVVLATVVKPPSNEGAKWLSRFQIVCKNRHMLGILGKYIASKIVATETLATLRTSFDNLYDGARREFMVTAEDLAGGISEEALRDKQMAKERSVFNHTVAKFGLLKFSEIVRLAVGKELDAELADLEAGIYTRMKDLQAATTPEYVKVLIELASMSYHVDDSSPQAIRKNQEYAFINIGGIDCIELAVRPAYFKYRAHCATAKSFPLFSGYDPFAYGLKDSPAFHKFGIGDALKTPNVFVFKLEELARLGVPNFKA